MYANFKMFSMTNLVRRALSRFRASTVIKRSATRSLSTNTRCRQQGFGLELIPPTTLSLSFLTLLGLESPTTPEDDLIKSIKYSILFIQRSEFDKAERLLHVALRQAQQMYHENGITYVYDVMANLALERDQLDKAKALFVSVAQRLMQNGATEDDLRIIHISLKLARISHLKKEYETAQTGFEWCLEKLYKQYKNNPSDVVNKLLAMGEDWYAKLYIDFNQAERALQLLLSSQERTRSLSDFQEGHVVIQLNDIATLYENLNRLDESEKYLLEAIEEGKKFPDMEDLGAIYVNLGRLYLKRGMLSEARKSCGFGWRLGHDRNNEDIKHQAKQCVEDVNKANT